jgi:spore coat protein U-like protein
MHDGRSMSGRVRHARTIVPAVLAFLFVATPSRAATCTVSPQNLSFGLYDPLGGSASDTVSTINVTCDAETAFEVSLGTGSGSYAARTMTAGPDTMVYNLYIDPQRTLVWGDGMGGSNTVGAVSADRDFTVYARAPAGQNLRPGSYADSVSITVTY